MPLLNTALVVVVTSATVLVATAALAQTYTSERDIGELRLGQRVAVDDGTCPAGQIKEVSGIKLTAQGVERSSRCMDRKTRR